MIKSNLTDIALSNILKDYLLSFQGKKVGKKLEKTTYDGREAKFSVEYFV